LGYGRRDDRPDNDFGAGSVVAAADVVVVAATSAVGGDNGAAAKDDHGKRPEATPEHNGTASHSLSSRDSSWNYPSRRSRKRGSAAKGVDTQKAKHITSSR
jgi:hypothetical protein